MILETYQSKLVWKILQSGETYRAKPNLGLRGQYEALNDLLGLHCECPIFGVVKGKKQNTGGKVSGAVKLTLNVPDDRVKLTEYAEWADFLYAYQFTVPGRYRSLRPDCEEVTVREYDRLLESLREQRPLSQYQCPQAVLEKIEPGWLKRARVMGKPGLLGRLFKK